MQPDLTETFQNPKRDLSGFISGQTRTSLLRTLNSSVHSDWLLPETRELFDKQWRRQQRATGNGTKIHFRLRELWEDSVRQSSRLLSVLIILALQMNLL